MIEGCLRQADGRSVADLERLRDGFLAELLELVDRYAVAPRDRSEQIRAEETGGEAEPAETVIAAGPAASIAPGPTAPAIH